MVAQRVKSLPAMLETQVQFLGWEDSPGEGNGNPLQYSCLENPKDRGARQATVYRVAKSRSEPCDFVSFLQKPKPTITASDLLPSLLSLFFVCLSPSPCNLSFVPFFYLGKQGWGEHEFFFRVTSFYVHYASCQIVELLEL